MSQTELIPRSLNEAETRLHQSGLVTVVTELGQRVPGAKVLVFTPTFDRGSYTWPSVDVRLPEVQVGDERGRLTLVFQSLNYPDRNPEIGLHGWLDQTDETGCSGLKITLGSLGEYRFQPDFVSEFPPEPSLEALREFTVPQLLEDFANRFKKLVI